MNKRDQVIQALACMPNLMLNGIVTIQDVINEVKKPDVVRCKDCIHFRKDGYCLYNNHVQIKTDWFCADGVASDE